MTGTAGLERGFPADQDGVFVSKLAPIEECIPNVGATVRRFDLLAKSPEKSAQNVF